MTARRRRGGRERIHCAPHPVAAAGLAVGVGAVHGWSAVRAHTRFARLLPRTTPGLVGVAAAVLGCLYTVVVGTCAAVIARPSVPVGLLLLAVASDGLAVRTMAREVRKRFRILRTRVVADSSLPEHTEPQVASTVRRLTQLADVPEPSVRVVDSGRPASMTVGGGDDAVLLMSSGLVGALPEAELEAVLVHEVAHLTNGDSRVVGMALGPVLAADEWIREKPTDPEDRFWNLVFGLLKRYGQFGVAILSRGRERAADVAAAELTGSPAALAGALERLTEARDRPETDFREWEHSVAAMGILPPPEPGVSTGPFRTHPPVETRVEHLRSMTESAETER